MKSRHSGLPRSSSDAKVSSVVRNFDESEEKTSFLRSQLYRSWWKSGTLYTVLSGILITGVAVFFFSTLREGHKWDGDYALYIMHARNIAEGLPYADTGFIPDPTKPIHPASYPPGLPLLLTPIYLFSGLDLEKMKMVGVSSFILFLLIFSHIMRQSLPWAIALTVTAIVGLHPYFWHFKDTIFSEFPFMLFCYATLYSIDNLTKINASPKLWFIFVSAILLALACLTRLIGLFILFPTIFLIGVYQSRRLVNPCILILAIGGAIIFLATLAFPQDLAYDPFSDQDSTNFSILVSLKENIIAYADAVRRLVVFAGGSNGVAHSVFGENWLTHLVPLAFFLLVLVGVISRSWVDLSIYEIFVSGYTLFLVAYPIRGETFRYLLPIWPLLLFYVVYGTYAVGSRVGRIWPSVLPAMLCSAFFSLYVAQYAKTDFGSIPYSVTDPTSRELFNNIKTKLPADAVLLFWKPTIMALFTDRRAAIWPDHFKDDALWRYMNDIEARYIVNMKGDLSTAKSSNEDRELQAFIERNQSALRLLFSNKWFNLYQISTDHISWHQKTR